MQKNGPKSDQPFKFETGKSSKAVTTKVKVVEIGDWRLIDTPGTNDPDKKRTDKQI